MPSDLDDELHDASFDVADPIASAFALEGDGRVLEAIELLTRANRRQRDAAIEARIVTLRHAAFETLDRPPHVEPAPAVTVQDPGPGPLRELAPAELTPATLRESIARYGCALVRGLVPRERAADLAHGIDRALEGFDAAEEGADAAVTSPWYVPFSPPNGRYRVGGRRTWVRASGALWTVDSPRMLFDLCELLDDTGVGSLATAHLGERPALSANKCTLRRVPIDTQTNWHQDGAFLGCDVRSLNLWLVLSDCGADAPGLEIVPRRLDHVVPTGTEGAMFDWSVSPPVVADVCAARRTSSITPEFRAGDALLFDHLLLHRTAAGPHMARERYAMETWMFAPSSYPDGQIPVVY